MRSTTKKTVGINLKTIEEREENIHEYIDVLITVSRKG